MSTSDPPTQSPLKQISPTDSSTAVQRLVPSVAPCTTLKQNRQPKSQFVCDGSSHSTCCALSQPPEALEKDNPTAREIGHLCGSSGEVCTDSQKVTQCGVMQGSNAFLWFDRGTPCTSHSPCCRLTLGEADSGTRFMTQLAMRAGCGHPRWCIPASYRRMGHCMRIS